MLLSIGIVLVFEGLLYYFFSNNLIKYLEQLKKIDPKKIRAFSFFFIVLGLSLIYLILRFY